MAVPKRRTSRSKTRKGRSNHAMKRPQVVHCPNCGAATLPHRVCPQCDYYKNRFYSSSEAN